MTTFYLCAAIAVFATVQTIAQASAVRALLYLIVSLLSVAVIFFNLGAPFAAALEVITYAGAIMVLFVFVIMMLNLGPVSAKQELDWMTPRGWIGPSVLSAILIAEFFYSLYRSSLLPKTEPYSIGPEKVGAALFGPYALGVELSSMLLLAGLVGAYHLGYRALAMRERAAPKLRLIITPPGERKRGAS